jgi:hypothetical protein
MKLILDPLLDYHVALDTIKEAEEAILRDRRVSTVRANHVIAKTTARLLRYLRRANIRFPGVGGGAITRDYFAVLMSVDVQLCVPYFLLPGRKSIYLMDAWPFMFKDIVELVNTFSIRHLFLSSSMACEKLQPELPECTITWIPEAIDPARYRFRPPAERDIDVLQLGRKSDKLHEMILPGLRAASKQYMYETVKGKVIFPTREGFVDGLSRTKISICVPAALTHPELAGFVELLSMRYLQSMVSKCLIVGHAPADLVSLFGYNPVVEVDMTDPAGHILSLLDHLGDYAGLIERNYEVVTQHHTWQHRWQTIAGVLYPTDTQPV